jgi:hypothetical protein
MVHDDERVGLDGVRVVFDDERVVSDAGIMLATTLAERLHIECLVEDCVRLCARRGISRGAQGDGADLRDDPGRGLDRGLPGA